MLTKPDGFWWLLVLASFIAVLSFPALAWEDGGAVLAASATPLGRGVQPPPPSTAEPATVPPPLTVALPTTLPVGATPIPPTEPPAVATAAGQDPPPAETPGDPEASLAETPPPDPAEAETPTPVGRRSPQPTPTRRGTQVPARLPTPFNLDPNGQFTPSYVSTAPVAGDRVMLRGKVMDRHKAAVGGVAVRAWNEETTQTVFTGIEGDYRFTGLPPGLYNVEVEGRAGQPAENIQLEARLVTVVEFAENVPEPAETAGPVIAAVDATSSGGGSSAVTASVPMGESAGQSAAGRRASPVNRDLLSGLLSEIPISFNPDPWLENLLLGAASAWALMLIGVAYATLRR